MTPNDIIMRSTIKKKGNQYEGTVSVHFAIPQPDGSEKKGSTRVLECTAPSEESVLLFLRTYYMRTGLRLNIRLTKGPEGHEAQVSRVEGESSIPAFECETVSEDSAAALVAAFMLKPQKAPGR